MAIEQHPIPQDVAGYKFRLIGEMTVKQFIWLAGGIILGIVTFSLPLPFFFKYPLTGIFVCLGAGIAFLPIEGRPMDKWLIAFIKSVYSPTEYIWQKTGSDQLTQNPSAVTKISPVTTTQAPRIATQSTPNQPANQTSVESKPIVPPQVPNPTPAPQPVVTSTPPSPTPSSVQIPTPAPTPMTRPQTPPTQTVESKPVQQPVITPPKPVTPVNTQPVTSPTAPTDNLPVPFTPSAPNTLVGMTLTPEGKILDGCLIEIRNNGLSIRATKSNQLGQFLFAKPLENGVYQILTEKMGYTFDTYSLNLTGQIIKPLRLQAKNHV